MYFVTSKATTKKKLHRDTIKIIIDKLEQNNKGAQQLLPKRKQERVNTEVRNKEQKTIIKW